MTETGYKSKGGKFPPIFRREAGVVWDGDIEAEEKWVHFGSILGGRENWLTDLYVERAGEARESRMTEQRAGKERNCYLRVERGKSEGPRKFKSSAELPTLVKVRGALATAGCGNPKVRGKVGMDRANSVWIADNCLTKKQAPQPGSGFVSRRGTIWGEGRKRSLQRKLITRGFVTHGYTWF